MIEMPNFFTEKELGCQHCGEQGVTPEALLRLNMLRLLVGYPLNITSAYRCPNHPIESKKLTPGQHSEGWAFDISCDGMVRALVLRHAGNLGFTSYGSDDHFIHIDCRPNPTSWTY
jgi:zinc D-Ala-D-Ala carboxypeptidase